MSGLQMLGDCEYGVCLVVRIGIMLLWSLGCNGMITRRKKENRLGRPSYIMCKPDGILPVRALFFLPPPES